jgi:hypothetical protein
MFFFITDRNGDGIIITDAHDADGINPSEIPSVIILPMVFVPYTDGMNPSAKLYNGVVQTRLTATNNILTISFSNLLTCDRTRAFNIFIFPLNLHFPLIAAWRSQA